LKKGDARQALAAAKKVSAEFYWPMQSHASMGPSCAVADVRDGKATDVVSLASDAPLPRDDRQGARTAEGCRARRLSRRLRLLRE
jgi:hypothetical protein